MYFAYLGLLLMCYCHAMVILVAFDCCRKLCLLDYIVARYWMLVEF